MQLNTSQVHAGPVDLITYQRRPLLLSRQAAHIRQKTRSLECGSPRRSQRCGLGFDKVQSSRGNIHRHRCARCCMLRLGPEKHTIRFHGRLSSWEGIRSST